MTTARSTPRRRPRSESPEPGRSRAAALALSLLLALGGPACTFLRLQSQLEQIAVFGRISGTVTSETDGEHPLVVVLLRDDGEEQASIVDHYALEGAGRWVFAVSPGRYTLAAFADLDSDLHYGPDEPAMIRSAGASFELAPGESISEVDLRIPAAGRIDVTAPVDIRGLQVRSSREQQRVTAGSLMIEGEVTTLDDPRFDRETASQGMWEPLEFALDGATGVYFLEEYDAGKIPVLFVHGIGGTPREFEAIIDALDRSRLQPWLYYYPSGLRLDDSSSALAQLVTRLHLRLGFEELQVVAHSMGGLVARGFLQNEDSVGALGIVRRFVSLSTPWGGHEAAATGVELAPVAVPAWQDLAPDSEFQRRLFFDGATPRPLPQGLQHHLLFGFQRNAKLAGVSSDRIVSLRSQLAPEAQRDADALYGFDSDHTGILREPSAAELVARLLAPTH